MHLHLFKKKEKEKRRIYLDHAAATPLHPRVRSAMEPYQHDVFGNPSAIHSEGKRARAAVEDARLRIARILGIRSSEISFTAGGTESNNLALRGLVAALKAKGVRTDEIEIVSVRTEHPSVLRTLEALQGEGCHVTYVPVCEDGLLDMGALKAVLTPTTKLVTIAYANSETGVVQDLGAIGRVLKAYEREHGTEIIFHTDASQAPLWLPCQLERLRVDMMTLDAGKFCGPKGVGMLAHRSRVPLRAVAGGGSQEEGLRPGTENVPGIVGAAEAFTIAQEGWEARSDAVAQVRDYAIAQLLKLDGVVLNGSPTARLANNINISLLGYDTEFAVVVLDTEGIAASTKSACSGAGSGRSTVVEAMSHDDARAASTIRLTLGEETQKEDMDRVIEALSAHLRQMATFLR